MFMEEQKAVVTATGRVSQKHVRDHLNENWSKYTDGLNDDEQLKVAEICISVMSRCL